MLDKLIILVHIMKIIHELIILIIKIIRAKIFISISRLNLLEMGIKKVKYKTHLFQEKELLLQEGLY